MLKNAIVILNWNGIKYLKQFLKNTIELSLGSDTEIFVADNGSTDESVKWIEDNFKMVHVIKLDKNYGFAEGYNRALSQISAEYYTLLNSDIEVTPGWMEKLISFMDSHKEVASAQPKIHAYHNKEYFEYAGAAGGFLDKLGYPVCRGRVFYYTETDKGYYDSPWEIFWATGACCIVRSEAWKRCGGFDGDFFAHMEEIDLCWRFHRAGYKVALVNNVVIYHIGGGTLPYNSPFKTYLNFRNGLFLLYKNLPDDNLKRIMYKRKILDGVASCFFFVKFQFRSSVAVIKAYRDFYRDIEKLKTKREQVKSLGDNDVKDLIVQKSIVFQFYIRRKKTFKEIVGL